MILFYLLLFIYFFIEIFTYVFLNYYIYLSITLALFIISYLWIDWFYSYVFFPSVSSEGALRTGSGV